MIDPYLLELFKSVPVPAQSVMDSDGIGWGPKGFGEAGVVLTAVHQLLMTAGYTELNTSEPGYFAYTHSVDGTVHVRARLQYQHSWIRASFFKKQGV